ncbi:MAG: hypothetical protein V2A79_05680 [Planctomycetota bacterium]
MHRGKIAKPIGTSVLAVVLVWGLISSQARAQSLTPKRDAAPTARALDTSRQGEPEARGSSETLPTLSGGHATQGSALLEARAEWARTRYAEEEAAELAVPITLSPTGWTADPPSPRAHTIGPDLILADISGLKRWGRVGDITAYSIGTILCNQGDEPVKWVLNTNEHPIIAQHMYRLKDGRLEHIGMSWVPHAFFALNGTFCYTDCVPGSGDSLGVHCSDSHSASVNGLQANMAPRYQVNAATAVFPYPWVSPPYAATIGRRLQVHDADLHPPSNPGALYFMEGQALTADEAAAGNDENNVSYRRITIVWSESNPTVYDVAFVSGQNTHREQPAIMAWQEADPGVTVAQMDIPADGRVMLAYRVTAAGGGLYHYEYVLYNMNSHRSVQSFSIPIPVGVTASNFGFHDVDYHSGDPWSLTDWPATLGGGSLTWQTTLYSVDSAANALRWGTTYNFRFDADMPPGPVDATLALFRPGTPTGVALPSLGPVLLTGADCNSNGIDDVLDIFAGTSRDCNRTGIPDECDIAGGTSLDCNSNGTPDECETDCNTNGIPDTCDIAGGTSFDCNTNGTPDECETDCNTNGTPDTCDIAQGTSRDCDSNGTPDECTLDLGMGTDCNTNGILDVCDIAAGTAPDCNGNQLPDTCDMAAGTSQDCNSNGVPDTCDLAGGTSEDCNTNSIPDECESAIDCNHNLVPDICDLAGGTSEDCNNNAFPDECDLAGGTSDDCNSNQTPDDCEFDCNLNGIPDDCDIAAGTSQDLNGNGRPDECEGEIPTLTEWGMIVMTVLLLAAGTLVIQRRRALSAVTSCITIH